MGWGCPCTIKKETVPDCWDDWPLLGDHEMKLGEIRTSVGFVFVSGQKAADELRAAGKFYLWEGGYIGEAVVLT